VSSIVQNVVLIGKKFLPAPDPLRVLSFKTRTRWPAQFQNRIRYRRADEFQCRHLQRV